jgi:serine/threonine-protein kinase
VFGDRYRVEETLGKGGMGVVCRATHLGLGTPVAIKVIRPDLAENEEFVGRFLNEARRSALLQSERIARVHDVGQLPTGEPFLVMELLDGVELGDYLEEHGSLGVADAVNIALQIAEGLAAAHQNGIVHRDIKPANTFLVRRTDGRFAVKILDFGISKELAEGATTLTDAGQSLGSPWYMSPEQMIDASRVDERSDLWSLGVVLFEMLTGQRPFEGVTVPEVCAKVLTAPAPLLSDFRPELPPALEALVGRCLQKDPGDRYPDVASLGVALKAALGEQVARNEAIGETSVEPSSYGEGDRTEGSIVPVAATRTTFHRRRRFAHALGLFGLVVTLGVFGLAFGKRTLASARHGAALVRSELVGAVPSPASAPAPAPPESEALPPTSAPTLEPAPTLLPAPSGAAAPASTAAPVPSTAPSGSASPSASSAAPVRQETARPFEPRLSAEEIQARRERYARWLAHEGLTPVDEQDVSPPRDAAE